MGTPWLLEELPDELALELLLREEYPSWLYEVRLGATTVWERWNSLTEDGHFSETGMNSLNHYAYGSVAAWVYRRLCGIAPEETAPGFRMFTWSPLPDPRIGFARCRLNSPLGEIVSEWEYSEQEIRLRLSVPFGSEALVRLPDGRRERQGAGEYVYRIPNTSISEKTGEDEAE